MNINMSDFFKNNISSGSQTADVNVSENVSHEPSGSNNAVQAVGMKLLILLCQVTHLQGMSAS